MAKKTPDTWTQDDAVSLRTFLAANPKFLRALRKKIPRNADSKTRDEAANIGMQMEGFMKCCDDIESMMQDQIDTGSPDRHQNIG